MKNLKKVLAIVLALVVVCGVFAACDLKITPEQKLVGAWRDSTGTTGYEFKDGGICTVTFADVNLPIVGNINTSVDGSYTVAKKDDDNYYVTLNYSLFGTPFSKEYMFTVDGSTLTLTDVEDNKVTVFMSYATAESTSATAAA